MTTVTELLFGSPNEARTSLTTSLEIGKLRNLPILKSRFAVPTFELTNAITSLLEMPIADLAISGWHQHQQVREACNRTRKPPGSREVLRMLKHKITSRQKPTIELVINGAPDAVLELLLEIEIEVSTVNLVIENGDIVNIEPGSATADGTLRASGIVLAHRQCQVNLDLREQKTPSRPPEFRS